MVMSLGKMLTESAERYPENTAVIQGEKRMTYRELNRATCALGNHLRSLGLGKGDKVTLMLPNCAEFIIAYFAVQKVGGVAVTLNVQSTPYELLHLLGNSDTQCLITQGILAKRFVEIRKELPLCRHVVTTNGPDEDSPFREIIANGPFTEEIPELTGDDPAVMIYTAGLTGKPLGAVLTHRNLLTQSVLLRTICNRNEKDIGLAVIPFFHSFGAVGNMLAVLRIGASVVLMDRFTLDGIFTAIEKEKITYIAAVPRLFLGMLFHQDSEKYRTDSLQICITGGAAMPPDFIPLFEKRFGVKIMEGYGLTEASPASSFSRLDMPQKPGSIGIPIPGVSAKIVDETGREVPRETVGELILKGDNIMKGYYKDEEMTAQVLKDGWLYTSDLGRMDAEGYIFLTGRKKRMIITSGFNVYPREIEIVLCLHPAVQTAHIVGKEDLLRGEIVRAIIVKKPGAEIEEKELLKHCRTYLSSYKVPREIEFAETIGE
ncbi:MAG: long-chain fatty acid--CoA ligase [Syntrophus sp. (in: bacteria)]|nr:long-chain fatty acid--CoA ligase [Syntrophus sp. (in: bacteria)]